MENKEEKWVDVCGRIHVDQIDNTKPSGKIRLTYDLTRETSDDVMKLYSALRGFANEVNKRFDSLKMYVEYPGREYYCPTEEGDAIKTYPPCEK